MSNSTTGRTDLADATGWGFDPNDATDAVWAAVDSDARRVRIPFVGVPWVIRPMALRSELELVFEAGVLPVHTPQTTQARFGVLARDITLQLVP